MTSRSGRSYEPYGLRPDYLLSVPGGTDTVAVLLFWHRNGEGLGLRKIRFEDATPCHIQINNGKLNNILLI